MSDDTSEVTLTRSELRVQRAEQQRADAAKVRSEIEAAKEAEQAKTVRLRALRLAKEAADLDAAAAAAAAKKPARKRSK